MQASDEKTDSASDRRIFESFGCLAFNMQLFDFSLAHVLGQVFGPGPTQRSASQVREAIERMFRCTAGQLSRKLQAVLGKGHPLARRIADAVTQRNYFVHHFFRETSGEAKTDVGRRAMIERIESATIAFAQLDGELTQVYRRWLTSHGVAIDSADIGNRDGVDPKEVLGHGN